MFGFYLPYDADAPQTGYLQRSLDGTKTWSRPKVPLDAARYTTWPRRIHTLGDGRIVLVAGVVHAPAGSKTRAELGKLVEPALLVSADHGRTWQGRVTPEFACASHGGAGECVASVAATVAATAKPALLDAAVDGLGPSASRGSMIVPAVQQRPPASVSWGLDTV